MLIFFTKTITLIAIIFTSFNSYSAIVQQCDSCTSQSDFTAVARYTATTQMSSSSDTLYLFNSGDNIMKKFNLIYMPTSEPGTPPVLSVREVSLTTSDITKINTSFAQRSIISDFLVGGLDIPGGVAGSAYDMIGSSQNLKKVNDYLNENLTLVNGFNLYTASLLSIGGKVINVSFNTVIRFEDNSSATMTISGVGEQFYIVLSTQYITDSDGNSAPLVNSISGTGEYNFYSNDNNIENFVNALSRMGISVDGYTSSSITSGRVTCTVNGSGGLSCLLRN